MASKKSKGSPIDMTNGSTPTPKQIERRYGSKMPAGNRSLGKAGYIKSLQDVAAEGPWGNTPRVAKSAAAVASKQWDRTFGPTVNKPAKPKAIRSKKK